MYCIRSRRPRRDAHDFLEIVRGEGCRVFDVTACYLDGTASLWYCAAGHGRREIIDAVAAQMAKIAAYHTFARFTNASRGAAGRAADRAGADPGRARVLSPAAAPRRSTRR